MIVPLTAVQSKPWHLEASPLFGRVSENILQKSDLSPLLRGNGRLMHAVSKYQRLARTETVYDIQDLLMNHFCSTGA